MPSLTPRQAGEADGNSSWSKGEPELRKNPPRVGPEPQATWGLNAQGAGTWTQARITSIKKGKAIPQVQEHG